jgi:hypothetical protein
MSVLHAFAVATLAFALALSGGFILLRDQMPPGQKGDGERLLGTWRITAMQLKDHDADAAGDVVKLMRLAFAKDGKVNFSILDEEVLSGNYTLRSQSQLEFSLNPSSGAAVFHFDGDDRLVMAVGGFLDAGLGLLVMERVKVIEKVAPADKAVAANVAKKMRQAADRGRSVKNLSTMALAMWNYLDAYKSFPLHAIYDKDGKTPLLSWRVSLLPFLEQNELFMEFKLDEAWDSPHNKKLIAKMPKVYAPLASNSREKGLTYYQVFTGKETLFDGTNRIAPRGIRNGASNTLLIIEAKEPVIWTQPADLTLPQDKEKMPGVGGQFQDRTTLALCDGSVHFPLTQNLTPQVLRALVTPNGGEVVDLNFLDR